MGVLYYRSLLEIWLNFVNVKIQLKHFDDDCFLSNRFYRITKEKKLTRVIQIIQGQVTELDNESLLQYKHSKLLVDYKLTPF